MAEVEQPRSRASTIDDPDLAKGAHQSSSAVWTSPLKAEDQDPRTSLQHVLAASPLQPNNPAAPSDPQSNGKTKSQSTTEDDAGKEEANTPDGRSSHVAVAPKDEPTGGSQPTAGRRNASSAVYGTTSVYSGNKIKHLKKEDGIPLWRKDIQYEFLKAVFEDRTRCFSHSYEYKENGFTFADVYIYAMALSSKTSKILRDKLMSDRKAAIHMAMVCLLVNVGRMNTTLNFFPEMRAQLRTYHSIPCLQARQDPNAYKQLQDAPRLKSILKGASEDKKEPNTIEAIMAQNRGDRTNPVNLIFVLAQHAVRVSELHFTAPREFFDLITRTTLSSKSRAKAFLWIMWWYLESNFTNEDALNNPFGPGLPSDDDNGIPIKVPAFEGLSEDQAAAENVDTAEEIAYGEQKRIERLKIMEADAAASASTPKNPRKKDDRDGTPSTYEGGLLEPRGSGRGRMKRPPLESYPSDTDQTRSASPGIFTNGDKSHGSIFAKDSQSPAIAPRKRVGNGRYSLYSWERNPTTGARIVLKTKPAQANDGSSPAPPGSSHPVLHPDGSGISGSGGLPSGGGGRRSRPLTAHQQAVERNRAHRVDYILDRKMRKAQAQHRRRRLREGALWRAWTRHDAMTDPFADSEDEEAVAKNAGGPVREQGFGGLMPLENEEDDWGEELGAYAAALRRMGRRLTRWDALDDMGKGKLGVVGTGRHERKHSRKEERQVFEEEEEGDGEEDDGEGAEGEWEDGPEGDEEGVADDGQEVDGMELD